MNPSLTESQVYTALGDFIAAVTGLSAANIVRGQVNRVPMPPGPNWFSMQATGKRLMATAERSYDPPVPVTPPVGTTGTGASYTPEFGTTFIGRSTALYFQVDGYGPASGDYAQVFTTLFNDEYGTEFFRSKGIGALYCEDPSQMPLIAGEQQYIGRWMIRVVLHAFIVANVQQGFADTLVTTLSEITHAV